MALFVLLVFGLCAGTAAAAGTLILSENSRTVDEGAPAFIITVTENPYNATLSLTAESSNKTVAIVEVLSPTTPGILKYNVIPGNPGQSTITFTSSDDLTGTFTLTVVQPVSPAVAEISLSAASITAAPGSTITFYALPMSLTARLPGKTVSWTDSVGGSGTADAGYRISYPVPQTASGEIQITCSCEGKTAVFTITVGQPTLKDISLVSFPDLSTALGYIDPFSVTAVGNNGGYVFGQDEITWKVDNASLVEKTGSSYADAQFRTKDADGAATITASAGGVSSAPLMVVVGTGVPPTPSVTPTSTASPSYDNGGADDGAQLLASVGGQQPGVTSTTSPTTSTGGDSGATVPGSQTGGDVAPGTEPTVSPTGVQPTQSTSTPPPATTRGPVPLLGILAGLGTAAALGRKYL